MLQLERSTPATLGLLVIHGIGEERRGYAAQLIDGVARAMRAALERVNSQPLPPDLQLLAAEETLWDRYVSAQQDALRAFLSAQLPSVAFTFRVRQFLNTWLGALLLKARARVVPFIEDIIAYQRADANALIYGELDGALHRLAGKMAMPANAPPLTVVAHSLGTIIASDFLWDRWVKTREGLGGFRLENLFTMGSPMAFYALKYAGGVGAFDKPITLEPPGCWVNLYHPTDPIATRLRPLNSAYRHAVLQDAEIRNHHLIAAHTSYWTDPRVHQIIGHKLALDWLRNQHALPPEQIRALQDRYHRQLCIA